MRAVKFFSLLALFVIFFSSCKVEDGGKIDLGEGRFLQTNLIAKEPGNGTFAWLFSFYKTEPRLEVIPQEGVSITSSAPEPYQCQAISIAIAPNRKIYWEPFEISTNGIIRKVELEKSLPGQARIEIREQTSQSIRLLAQGAGETYNKAVAYLWVQPIEGIPFSYQFEPEWARVTADPVNIWKSTVNISTKMKTVSASLRVINLNELKMLWWEPSDFFPLAEPTGPDGDGNFLVQNVQFQLLREDGTPLAPPSQQVISAMLAECGYEKIDNLNSVLFRGQTVLKTKDDVPAALPLVSPVGKKITSMGFIKKE